MQITEVKPGRLALFLHDLSVGGAERVMLQLAKGFSKEGVPVDLVLARAEGALLSEVFPEIRIVDLKAKNPFAMLFGLIKYLYTERPRTILSPFEVTSVISLFARKISGVATRVVVRISVNLSQHKRHWVKKRIEQWVVKWVYPWADAIVAVSQGVADDFVVYTGIPLDSVKVIYNPIISEGLLLDMNKPVDHPFFNDLEIPVILGVGRLTEQKDFSTLVRAFDKVRKKKMARLIILGEGEERSALEKLASSLGLEDVVDFPGFNLTPFMFMRRASAFVLSSKWEGLPGALIQALACGCPVVSTNCLSGPSEILNDGQYGHLVPVGDVDGIARAIELILEGDSRKPPESWMEQYKVDTVLQQYKKVLNISNPLWVFAFFD